MPAKIEVTGLRFSRLVVLGDAEPNKVGRRQVACVCDCGNKTVVQPRWLRNRKTTSCGCAQKEAVGKASASRKQFDIPTNKIPEYSVWLGAKKRCFNKNELKYPSYGGRGITVCDQWVDSFETFYRDMGPRPTAKHSIDRIDVNGDYSPQNCRWATAKEQALNKRNHVWVEYLGNRMPLSEACRLAGINYRSALYRVNQGQHFMPLPLPPVKED